MKRKYGKQISVKCSECNKEFWTIPSRPVKFCSRECYINQGNEGQFVKGHISKNKGKKYRKVLFKICLYCKKEFERPYYLDYKGWEKRKYCGKFCSGMGRRKKDYLLNKKKCLICGKELLKNKGDWNSFLNRKYCSIKCKGMAIRGNKSLNWKGGRTTRGNGYTGLFNPKHPYVGGSGYIMEHRLNIEKDIGRFLLPTEIVHHIDGNKGNNKIENLVLCKNKSNHKFLHAKMENFMYKLIRRGKVYYDKEKNEFMETKKT